jgi:hypothetical protein
MSDQHNRHTSASPCDRCGALPTESHRDNCPGIRTGGSDGGPAKSKLEAVNHPKHYGGDVPYEVIKVLEAWMSPDEIRGFCLGNSIKYLSRAGKKDPAKSAEDIDKAIWYANRAKGHLKV